MDRVLGLDVGDRRIGVAVSDALGITAQPVETYWRVGYGPDVRHFLALCKQYGTRSIVCGLPRNMSGRQGDQADKVFAFAQQLEDAGLLVQYEDERLTTVLAENALLEADMSREGRKKKVDMIAATLILQSWLDRQKAEQQRTAEEEPAAPGTEDTDLMEFEDENGEVVQFRIVADISRNGERYLLMSDLAEEGDTFFLQELSGEDGSVSYRSVEEPALIEELYEEYLRQCEE
ncbi:MAG: Holliday junction resolvase RuvX [Clostridia bacterium]|nr:Holliday junction resolvase RuvX [Clostridia bacterium]